MDWKAILSRHPVFKVLDDATTKQILLPGTSKEREFSEGQTIVREGEPGRSMFLIGTGVVSVVLEQDGGMSIPVATLGSGEIFGEMALIEEQPRVATVISKERTVLLEILAEEFDKLLDENPKLGAKFLLIMSERLRHVDKTVVAETIKSLGNQMQLFKTKLDAELKAMESSMKASQAIFEQTSKRADEVILSGERVWSRMTILGSVVLGAFTVIGGLLGFLGITEFRNITSLVDKHTASIEEDVEYVREQTDVIKAMSQDAGDKLKTIDNMATDIGEMATDIGEMESSVQQARFRVTIALRPTYLLYLRSNFAAHMHTDIVLAEDMCKEILAHGTIDDKLTEELFIHISRNIVTSDETNRDDYRWLLDSFINNGYAETNKQMLLSYFHKLVSQILDLKHEEFEQTSKKFEEYVGKSGPQINPDLISYIRENFYNTIHTRIIYMETSQIIAASHSKQMQKELEEVMKVISQG